MAALITLNAAFGAALLYGLVFMLTHGLHADRRHRIAVVKRLRVPQAPESDRLAA